MRWAYHSFQVFYYEAAGFRDDHDAIDPEKFVFFETSAYSGYVLRLGSFVQVFLELRARLKDLIGGAAARIYS